MTLRETETEVAEVLLNAIKTEAEDQSQTGSAKYLDLANAYAAVVAAAPRQAANPRGGGVVM